MADSLVETNPEDGGSGGDYDLAKLYISVSGSECGMAGSNMKGRLLIQRMAPS
ncbi:hypothetical protein KEJ34_03380 [Candidatus Bathyarchaeota archaeon]|nr:hypothetical protein [Candidatus Bathyarchaeota archaeon]